MCGIVGYIGKNIQENLIENLKKLEYRGYDSSGIATKENGKIKIVKAVGNISALEKIIAPEEKYGSGIAHTRWATHGKVTVENAHPHFSNNKKWYIVHNGIIENYIELKKQLLKKNIKCNTQTDSEIVAQLLEINNGKTDIEKLTNVCNELTGSFALVCINDSKENELFLAKRKSPLFVAETETDVMVASDPICFYGKTDNYYSLQDNEFCVAKLGKIEFFSGKMQKISKKSEKNNINSQFLGKKNFPHYMLKEINDIPFALKNFVETYSNKFILSKINKRFLKNIDRIKIIACGTAYHSALIGAKYIERATKIETTAHIASEFIYEKPIINNRTLCIFVSQSGETADTLQALEMCKRKKAKLIAITNVLYSSLSKKCKVVLPICAGVEIAVASTKAYNLQLCVFYVLSGHFKEIIFNKQNKTLLDIKKLSKKLKLPSFDDLKEFIEILKNSKKVFVLGKDLDYITAQESALKFKEITYINCNAYASGELKHGVLALVEKDVPIIVYATQKELTNKTINSANETLSRGGKVLLITQQEIDVQANTKVLKLKKFKQPLMPISAIIPMQLISYYVSIFLNINPDQPRNLAKSVTVE